jgi:hypothetical protein
MRNTMLMWQTNVIFVFSLRIYTLHISHHILHITYIDGGGTLRLARDMQLKAAAAAALAAGGSGGGGDTHDATHQHMAADKFTSVVFAADAALRLSALQRCVAAVRMLM